MRECGLLDRQERPDFIAARADHANRAGENQEEEVARQGEGQACGGHQAGADDERPPPSEPIGVGREVQ